MVGEGRNQWDKHTSAITIANDSAKNRATFYSPHFLMFWRIPRIELDLLDCNQNSTLSEDDYVNQMLEGTNKAFDYVKRQINKNIDYRIKQYSPSKKINYEIGFYAPVFDPKRK